MTLPALEALAAHGYTLTLVGKPWSKSLFSAYPWPMVTLSGSRFEHICTLRRISGKGNVGLLMTNSFGTAQEFRLAGIPPIGYARDGRSWLLRKAVPVVHGDHMVEYYYRLATELGAPPDVPRDFRLRIDEAAHRRAHDLLNTHGVRRNYIVLCPVATGFHRGKVKAWSGFAQLSRALSDASMQVVAMPGPNETKVVRAALPQAIVLPESDLGIFAAVLAGARLVVANDSGPGHLAAAVGARLISVFGVTEPEKTRPWSSRATLVGSKKGWPSYQEVRSAVDLALAA
jgi:heptosyltransferase II